MQEVPQVTVGPAPLTPAEIVAVARDWATVTISKEAIAAMTRSRRRIEELAASPTPAYGVSTGFGALATRHIDEGLRATLQRSLIRSHAAGMGAPIELESIRAMMLLRLRTLATGYTGVRSIVGVTYAALLNARITPVVHEHGSLGCSGDLAPLAHVALVAMGEGDATGPDGEVRPAADLLATAGIVPLELGAKEGLALINGTDGMLGMLVLACEDFARLLSTADITAAMSVEALLGTDRVFAAELHTIRPQVGQGVSASNIRSMLAGSPIVASHLVGDTKVQDAYSLRCSPQVAGAARDTLSHAQTIAARERASIIDNPVVLPDGRVESNGNFHGAPVGFVLDFLAIAAAELGAIAERRTDRMLDPHRSHGLPPFLAHDPGVDSGLMIAHYTQAAMVAENRRLAAPASVDSLPTSAMQEDHVSMGWGAARKLRVVVANLTRILAVELVTAARALDLRAPLTAAPGTAAVVAAVREVIAGVGPDRWLAPELAAAEELVRSGRVVAAAETVVGPLA